MPNVMPTKLGTFTATGGFSGQTVTDSLVGFPMVATGHFVPAFGFQSSLVCIGTWGVGLPVTSAIIISDTVPGANWVGWSKIGDIRLLVDASNEAGFRPMSYPGYVYRVVPYGKDCIIYGSDGITRMYPVASPVASFGFEDIASVGLLHAAAVVGNNAEHYFINKNKELCRINAKGSIVLGYREFISAICPANNLIVLSQDELTGKVYISSSLGGLIYSSYGLGKGYGFLTSVARISGQPLYASPGAITVPSALLETDTIDIENRGLKTIQWLNFGMESTGLVEACVKYRYDKQASFMQSPWVPTTIEGAAYVNVTAVDFRVCMKSSQTISLDYIEILYNEVDRRFNRESHRRYTRRTQ